jgi:hypothetical protein
VAKRKEGIAAREQARIAQLLLERMPMEPQEKTATCLQEGLMTRLQERAGRWKSMIVKGLKEEFVKALQNRIGIENLKLIVLVINPL